MHPTATALLLITGVALAALADCSSAIPHKDEALASKPPPAPAKQQRIRGLRGMPPVLDPNDL